MEVVTLGVILQYMVSASLIKLFLIGCIIVIVKSCIMKWGEVQQTSLQAGK